MMSKRKNVNGSSLVAFTYESCNSGVVTNLEYEHGESLETYKQLGLEG